MEKILITYFGAFGGQDINPSMLAVDLLPDKINGVNLIKKELAVEFEKSTEQLSDYFAEIDPSAVVCVGLAGGRAELTVERVAINLNDARIPDNSGFQPIDVKILANNAPDAYFSKLPIKAMAQQSQQVGVPASVSNTAGTYVCNHVMYLACHWASQKSGKKAGFIHVPFVPEQTAGKTGVATMHLDDIVKGLTAMIEAILDFEDDIRVTGGAEH